ncbi:MAG: hypothetical protein SNJ55_09035 [Chloroherpetonaceae bacterium]
MSLRYLLCLANSKKYGERCIAGIELEKSGNIFRVVRIGDQPKWIRPVSEDEFGAISESIAGKFALLDVIEIMITNSVPLGYQSENVRFKENSLIRVAQLQPSHELLRLAVDKNAQNLFGNSGKAVSREKISTVSYSLMCIKPQEVAFSEQTSVSGYNQIRCTFLFQNQHYDLPVTDILFCREFKHGKRIGQNIYLTISLGLEFEGWHYKLVAGVILF